MTKVATCLGGDFLFEVVQSLDMFTVLFDIDGTIMDSGGAGRDAMHLGMEECFDIKVTTSAQTFAGRTDLAIVSELMKKNGVEPDDEKLANLAAAYLKHLPSKLKNGDSRLLPGVRELLEELKAKEVVLGLLTGNLPDGARLKLEHYDLFHYFGFGGYGDKHSSRNDVASDALVETEKSIGKKVQKDQVWVIGDTPADVACARHIGVKIAAVCTGINTRQELEECKPDIVFDDLSDLKYVINSLGVS